jgi:hypothetical protein
VGVLTFDTFPFSVGGAEREDGYDYAKHELMNRRRGYEAEGAGDDVLTLSGEFLPFHIGGLSELEMARGLKNSGSPQFVMRGDGTVLGWYVITSIKDSHTDAIAPNGVAYRVKYEIKLEAVDDPGEDAGAGLIASLVSSLFG